jgi:ABC-type branched-subunit amino acid transport system ATPase component
MVPGVDGGMVFLGEPTSGMSKKEMSDLIELVCAFGAEHGVEWSDPL